MLQVAARLTIVENQLVNPASFANFASPGTTPSLDIKPRGLSDGAVPGEAKLAKEAGLTSWFYNGRVSCCYLKHLNWKFLKQSAA